MGTGSSSGVWAFVFTDVEGSTVAWEREPEAMRAAMARHHELVDRVAAAHGGERAVEQGAGDSTVVAFRTPSDALRAAVELQSVVTVEVWPTAEPVRVRVAVHAGEVHRDVDGSFTGPTMNRCGRLLGAAHGGQVVASASTVELAGDPAGAWGPDVEVIELGNHRLRGIGLPMRIVALWRPGLARDLPPLRTLDGAALGLPRHDTAFVGQEDLLGELDRLVARGGLVTLVGTGGCGKTRLAVEAATRAVEQFRDGVVWIDLSLVADGTVVDDAAAAALGATGGTRPARERVVEHLLGRHALVVVDNCEHVVEAAAALVTAVRSGCPEVSLLATSREPLDVTEEVVRRVPSLSSPTADTAEAVTSSDAGRLLVDRIRRVRPDFELDDRGVHAVREICERLDGIPLALELAASRTRSMSIDEVVAGLTERFALLTGGGRNLLARQRTLEASVAWSHQLLSAPEAAVFRRLSVFSSPFTVDAAVAVCGDGLAERDVRDAVAGLVDRSLLVAPDGSVSGRWRMLETIRHFGRERLLDAGESVELRDRHLSWVTRTWRDAEALLEGPDLRDVMADIDQVVDELRAAARWASDSGRGEELLDVVLPTTWYWILRARFDEALGWIRRALELGVDPAHRLAARWQELMLELHHYTVHDEVTPLAAEALELAEDLGDRRTEGRIRLQWAMHLAFRDAATHLADIERGVAMCAAEDDHFAVAYGEACVALCHVFAGRDDLGDRALDRAVEVLRQHPSTRLEADIATRRAFVDFALGRYDDVLVSAGRVVEVLRGVSDVNVQGTAEALAAWVEIERGGAAATLGRIDALLQRYLVAGEYQHVPSLVLALARALLAEGRPSEARARLVPVWEFPDVQAFERARLWFRHDLALADLLEGHVDDAESGFRRMLDDAMSLGNPQEEGRARLWLGLLARRRGQPGDAVEDLQLALDLQARHGYRQLAASAMEGLAGLELDHGRPDAAARLLGAAAAVRSEAGVTTRVGWQDAYDADVAAVRAALGEERFETELDAGRATSFDDAVALAARGRGERGRPSFGWESLTATEQRVARLVAEGATNARIASELLMGRETVKSHVSSILRKLGLENRTQVAAAVVARERN